MTDALLEISDLSVDFATLQGKVRVLNDLSLSVRQAEMMGVVGETGSGKTVLQRAIIGRIPQPGRIVNGEIRFNGQNLVGLPEEEFRELRGKQLSLIPPGAHEVLNPLVSVGRQIANVIRAHRGLSDREAEQEAVELIRSIALPDPELRARSYPHELSSGMAQRILIAMALANSPTLVLADEPTSSLDVTVQLQVLDLFATLVRTQRSSALIVTRDLGIVAHFCQRVAIMRYGMIYEIAPVQTFFKDARHEYSRALLAAARASRGEVIISDEARRLLTQGLVPGSNDGRKPGHVEQVGDDHFVRTSE
jgi:ABC-type dipeptide/oligopeptide/nickel transport system ATPase component